jgi:hypothetical protein
VRVPSDPNSKTESQVVAFNRGTGDQSKTVGQIPASYKQGAGTILSGTTANIRDVATHWQASLRA